jgi:hypothetical protein
LVNGLFIFRKDYFQAYDYKLFNYPYFPDLCIKTRVRPAAFLTAFTPKANFLAIVEKQGSHLQDGGLVPSITL